MYVHIIVALLWSTCSPGDVSGLQNTRSWFWVISRWQLCHAKPVYQICLYWLFTDCNLINIWRGTCISHHLSLLMKHYQGHQRNDWLRQGRQGKLYTGNVWRDRKSSHWGYICNDYLFHLHSLFTQYQMLTRRGLWIKSSWEDLFLDLLLSFPLLHTGATCFIELLQKTDRQGRCKCLGLRTTDMWILRKIQELHIPSHSGPTFMQNPSYLGCMVQNTSKTPNTLETSFSTRSLAP